MNLFLLDRTPMDKVSALSVAPVSGDMIIYFRPGQDPEGGEAERLRARGIGCKWAEMLLDRETSLETDRIGGNFTEGWYRPNGIDLTKQNGMSFGRFLEWEIGRLAAPKFMVRTGEMIRRAIAAFDATDHVYSDFTDGEGIDRVKPEYRRFRRLAELVAESSGRRFTQIESIDALPPLIIRQFEISWLQIIRTFIGGLRPPWIAARFKWRMVKRRRNANGQTIYAFVGRGTDLIVKRLNDQTEHTIITNRIGPNGTYALRHDHLLAFPKWRDVKTAWRIISFVSRLGRVRPDIDPYCLNGICYGPILADGALAILKNLMWKNILALAQIRKLHRLLDCGAMIINADAGFLMGGIIALNGQKGAPSYYVGHGLNQHRYCTFGMGHNHPDVTYITHGTDHKSEYGVGLPDDQSPRKIMIGNPLTVLMNPVAGQRAAAHGKRILILGSGFAGDMTATRSRSCERHLIDIFVTVRELAEDGWRATYRGHPHHAMQLERKLAARTGVIDIISWDRNAELSDSLLQHDVAIAAFSSTFYQCLYAGWPTIYYDPAYLGAPDIDALFPEELFCGVLTARDLWRPIAVTRENLKRMILESRRPDSMLQDFTKKFTTEYADRFVGQRSADADSAIAEFIARDIAGGTCTARPLQPGVNISAL